MADPLFNPPLSIRHSHTRQAQPLPLVRAPGTRCPIRWWVGLRRWSMRRPANYEPNSPSRHDTGSVDLVYCAPDFCATDSGPRWNILSNKENPFSFDSKSVKFWKFICCKPWLRLIPFNFQNSSKIEIYQMAILVCIGSPFIWRILYGSLVLIVYWILRIFNGRGFLEDIGF